ncbi:hypothetical protein WJR50_11250 [Catalinimonas sp. 4WD22]|uniref:hypothetical protein n=1 Tax=Catalinimonas locisalis TaxID=3133978 RepID=UPI0031010215
MPINSLVKRVSPKNLFLMDSMGALLTALMLGFVLTSFENVFGVPTRILYILSVLAFSYSVYSFVCFLKVKEKWRLFLKGIAVANIMYCFLTIGLVIYLRSALTNLGITYFLLEVMIILGLVVIELRKANSLHNKEPSVN